MSMAVKYNMMKKHKMARGGAMCAEGCDMLHEHKYADGGEVEDHDSMPSPSPEASKGKATSDAFKSATGGGSAIQALLHSILGGGEEAAAKEEGHADGGLIDSIMAKRYSHGGQVANKTGFTADFDENQFDDLVLRDDLEEHYTGANSGDEIGNHQKEEDERDLVSMIMKSRHKKDRLPRPA